MSNINLEAMKNIDIMAVDPSTLTDIRDVKINEDLPKTERMIDFIRQVKNPYCYKCGKTVIKNTYPNTKTTFTDRFKQLISNS